MRLRHAETEFLSSFYSSSCSTASAAGSAAIRGTNGAWNVINRVVSEGDVGRKVAAVAERRAASRVRGDETATAPPGAETFEEC